MAKPFCILILLVAPVLTICLAEVVFEERFDGKGKGEGVEFLLKILVGCRLMVFVHFYFC